MWAQSPGEVGQIVAAGRRHRGLTQAQLAKVAGATQKWISEIEQGKGTAQIGKILQVLSLLGVRLQVGEAPWAMRPERKPARSKSPAQISLADIIAAHSGATTKRAPKRKKAKR